VVRTSELRAREVIGMEEGRRLGALTDLEIDLETGTVGAIVLPGPGRLFGLFGRSEETVVPWQQIAKIGVDVILVSLEGTAPRAR